MEAARPAGRSWAEMYWTVPIWQLLARPLAAIGAVVAVVIVGVALAGCTDNDGGPATYSDPEIQDVLDLPATPFGYEPALPAAYLAANVVGVINTPADNPITDAGATLGRVLFYDTQLSLTGTVACASCHRASAGFADSVAKSEGFDGGATHRNSMSLIDVRYYRTGKMFWDERADSVEHQVLMPIQDSVEMGMTTPQLVERLQKLAYYPPLFELAFGDDLVTSHRVSLALSQFVRSIVSYQSPYDTNTMTPLQQQGRMLFFGRARCAGCHAEGNGVTFLMDRPRNNGLAVDTSTDEGVGDGRFKSPSLRNVALTAPYMHDGSIASLREVVEHYNTGVKPHAALDPRLRGPSGEPLQLNLSPSEIDALVAFLGALTDPSLATSERHLSPFRAPR